MFSIASEPPGSPSNMYRAGILTARSIEWMMQPRGSERAVSRNESSSETRMQLTAGMVTSSCMAPPNPVIPLSW